jgi:hypothetical protein
LGAGRRSHARRQFRGFFARQRQRKRRSSTSGRGLLLGALPYRSPSKMYSSFSAIMSGPDH